MCLEFTQSQGGGGCVGGDLMDVWQGGADGGGQVPSAKGPPESPENAPRLGFLSAPVPWKKKTEQFLFFIYLFNFFAASWTSAWLGTARPGTLMLLSASLLPPWGPPTTARVEVLGTGSGGDPFFHFNCINN